MSSPLSLVSRNSDRNHWTLSQTDSTRAQIIDFVSTFSFPENVYRPVVYAEIPAGQKQRIVVGKNNYAYLIARLRDMNDRDQCSGVVKTGRLIVESNHPLFREGTPLLSLHNQKPALAVDEKDIEQQKQDMLHGAALSERLCNEGVSNIARPLDFFKVFTGKGREKVVLIYPRYALDLVGLINKEDGAPPLTLPFVLSMQKDLVSAVSAIASRGMIYRDLKPENILVDSKTPHPCMLIDLDQCSKEILEPEYCHGAPRVMPPEYALAYYFNFFLQKHPTTSIPESLLKLVVDKDKGPIFSLGVIYYVLLTPLMFDQMSHLSKLHQCVFGDRSANDVSVQKLGWIPREFVRDASSHFTPELTQFFQKLKGSSSPFGSCPPSSHPIVHLVTKMLAPDPKNRPSFEEVKQEIETIITQEEEISLSKK